MHSCFSSGVFSFQLHQDTQPALRVVELTVNTEVCSQQLREEKERFISLVAAII
jgi:hypothetical protein